MPGRKPAKDIFTFRDFERLARAEKPPQPERLTLEAYRALPASEREVYDEARRLHHAALGPFNLGQLKEINRTLRSLIRRNVYLPVEEVRYGLALDDQPFQGKTTLLRRAAYDWLRQQREKVPSGLMEDGLTAHVPACMISLQGNCSSLDLMSDFRDFYELDVIKRESSNAMARRVRAAMLACDTTLVCIDELHFVRTNGDQLEGLSNDVKALMNGVPATFVVAGVGLERHGLFGFLSDEGQADESAAAQTGERLIRYALEPQEYDTREGRKEWKRLVATFQKKFVLGVECSLLDDDELEYLHERSGGSIGALAQLLFGALDLVVELEGEQDDDGEWEARPVLDRSVLEQVRLSARAEARADAARQKKAKTASEARAKAERNAEKLADIEKQKLADAEAKKRGAQRLAEKRDQQEAA